MGLDTLHYSACEELTLFRDALDLLWCDVELGEWRGKWIRARDGCDDGERGWEDEEDLCELHVCY